MLLNLIIDIQRWTGYKGAQCKKFSYGMIKFAKTNKKTLIFKKINNIEKIFIAIQFYIAYLLPDF